MMIICAIIIWVASLANPDCTTHGSADISAIADSQSIAGIVLDPSNDEPVPYAWILVETRGALSANDGSFIVTHVSPGEHNVTVSRHGYMTTTKSTQTGMPPIKIYLQKSDNWAVSTMLTGIVLDYDSNRPIEYASIQVVGTSRGTMTWEDGRFVIEGLQPRDYEVVVVMMGYHANRYSIILNYGKSVILEARLHRKSSY